MQALAQEIEGLEGQVAELKEVPSLLEEATQAEAEIRTTLGQSVAEQEHLEELSDRIAKIGVQIGIVERSIDGAEGWRQRLSAAGSGEKSRR